ncbi:Nucleoporin p58/p45, partial [Gamsiella multidivaricata]
FGTATSTPAAPASTTAPSLFGATAPTTSTAVNPFGGTTASPFGSLGATPASSAASNLAVTTALPTAAPTATTTTASLYPTLAVSTSAASTSATAAPSLFAAAPAALSTGSLFNNASSTAASNALSTAAQKNTLTASSLTATPAAALTPDTIAGSTKYTELPVDAKNMLDQFHSFLQGQIHLSATLTARPSGSLDKISKDTEELSKRLATLNDALDRDTKVIQALQDNVGQELKQADSAGRTIEAYADTSRANFLYAGDNSAGQYFTDRCQSFEEQLRQFRSTIEEIERHLASFGAKHPPMAQALPEVMRNQHGAFLTVAGRVATLHDEIRDKEKAYLMFRRKYYDDDSDPFQTSSKHRKKDTSQYVHSLRSSGWTVDGQKSFREIAKETLRPGNANTAKPAVSTTAVAPTTTGLFGAAPAAGTNFFGSMPSTTATMTSAAPTFSLTAPATTIPTTGLFGAPATSTPATGLFGAPAAASFGGFKIGK